MKKPQNNNTVLLIAALVVTCIVGSIAAVISSSAAPNATQPPTEPAPSTTLTQPTVPTTAQPVTVPPTTVPPTTVPPVTTQPIAEPELTASHAFICRWSDGKFLYQRGSMQERIYPASITKLLVAYVALQHLAPDHSITVGTAIYTVPPDSSLAFISIGDVLTTEQLLYGMLLPSGGDAARMVAAEAGRVLSGKPELSDLDAISTFMAEVNRQASLLGMTDTHFITPDGFHDPDHYTTMADLMLLAKLCLEHPLLRQIVNTTEYTVTLNGRTSTWRNTNMLLKPSSTHPQFYRETAIGLKTGYTRAAGRCLLAAFVIDGETYLSGVFGCPDPNFGFIAQFENICALYDTYLQKP